MKYLNNINENTKYFKYKLNEIVLNSYSKNFNYKYEYINSFYVNNDIIINYYTSKNNKILKIIVKNNTWKYEEFGVTKNILNVYGNENQNLIIFNDFSLENNYNNLSLPENLKLLNLENLGNYILFYYKNEIIVFDYINDKCHTIKSNNLILYFDNNNLIYFNKDNRTLIINNIEYNLTLNFRNLQKILKINESKYMLITNINIALISISKNNNTINIWDEINFNFYLDIRFWAIFKSILIFQNNYNKKYLHISILDDELIILQNNTNSLIIKIENNIVYSIRLIIDKRNYLISFLNYSIENYIIGLQFDYLKIKGIIHIVNCFNIYNNNYLILDNENNYYLFEYLFYFKWINKGKFKNKTKFINKVVNKDKYYFLLCDSETKIYKVEVNLKKIDLVLNFIGIANDFYNYCINEDLQYLIILKENRVCFLEINNNLFLKLEIILADDDNSILKIMSYSEYIILTDKHSSNIIYKFNINDKKFKFFKSDYRPTNTLNSDLLKPNMYFTINSSHNLFFSDFVNNTYIVEFQDENYKIRKNIFLQNNLIPSYYNNTIFSHYDYLIIDDNLLLNHLIKLFKLGNLKNIIKNIVYIQELNKDYFILNLDVSNNESILLNIYNFKINNKTILDLDFLKNWNFKDNFIDEYLIEFFGSIEKINSILNDLENKLN